MTAQSKVEPLTSTQRSARYRAQNRRDTMTARQMRRLRKKYNRTLRGGAL